MNRTISILLFCAVGLGTPFPPETPAQQKPQADRRSSGKNAETAALAQAAAMLPAEERPILRGGVPMAFYRDLDGDGIRDLLLPGVITPTQEKSTFLYLSDLRRILDPEAENYPFFLEIFLRRSSGWQRKEAVDLGSRKGCSAFEELPYLGASGVPYGLSLTFPTLEGSEHVWILFSRSDKPKLFSFYEKTGVKPFLRDLDNDGKTDLVIFEDVFEDSTGHETYVTWYKWDGTTYRKHKTTNLVRNLKAFLLTIKELLVAEKWKAFLDYALPSWKAPVVKKDGPEKTLVRLFKPAKFGEDLLPEAKPFLFDAENLKGRITDIVFPEILENPFSLKSGGLENFTLTFRVRLPGEHHFFTARLALDPNPFSEKMFFFILD